MDSISFPSTCKVETDTSQNLSTCANSIPVSIIYLHRLNNPCCNIWPWCAGSNRSQWQSIQKLAREIAVVAVQQQLKVLSSKPPQLSNQKTWMAVVLSKQRFTCGIPDWVVLTLNSRRFMIQLCQCKVVESDPVVIQCIFRPCLVQEVSNVALHNTVVKQQWPWAKQRHLYILFRIMSYMLPGWNKKWAEASGQ